MSQLQEKKKKERGQICPLSSFFVLSYNALNDADPHIITPSIDAKTLSQIDSRNTLPFPWAFAFPVQVDKNTITERDQLLERNLHGWRNSLSSNSFIMSFFQKKLITLISHPLYIYKIEKKRKRK